MRYIIKPSSLQGTITIPPSKSHTLRAILFASLAHGTSTIYNFLNSPDTDAMINACQHLGASINKYVNHLIIHGVEGKIKTPADVINAGNSGQVLRFIAAISALNSGYTVITGDHSIRHQRPVQPLLNALNQLDVFAVSTKNDSYAPLIIKGPLQGGTVNMSGEDSQPVSGLLIAAAFAKQATTIHVKNPGETPWINVTLDWFKRLGIPYQQDHYVNYIIEGNAAYAGFEYTVPGDFSSAAFPLVAAIVTQSEITLNGLDMHDIQGDKEIIEVLHSMGAIIEKMINQNSIKIKHSPILIGKKINVNHIIDTVPILAVVACFAQHETNINGAAIARHKESDRLTAITQELKKMGADIEEFTDGLCIKPSKLTGSIVHSHQDHRIAMALTVAALAASGETIIEDVECIEKSYPHFAQSLQQLGANIEIEL